MRSQEIQSQPNPDDVIVVILCDIMKRRWQFHVIFSNCPWIVEFIGAFCEGVFKY